MNEVSWKGISEQKLHQAIRCVLAAEGKNDRLSVGNTAKGNNREYYLHEILKARYNWLAVCRTFPQEKYVQIAA